MMLVVADSSPIIALINIGRIEILPALFGQVIIPSEVAEELRQNNRPLVVREFVTSRPDWLLERVPSVVDPIAALHAGELAAISLAIELRADLLLIDEVRGRKAAASRQIPFTGTIGILEIAADRGLLELANAFAALKQTDFWVSHELLDVRLKIHEDRRRAT